MKTLLYGAVVHGVIHSDVGGLECLMILFGKLKYPLKLVLVGENII